MVDVAAPMEEARDVKLRVLTRALKVVGVALSTSEEKESDC